MTDDINEEKNKTKTFRFGSGEIITLDDCEIEHVPYLSAITCSGDYFDSTRDDDGHFKLDANIKYEHFLFILESISFDSISQLFSYLPKQYDVIPIIALYDFLGMTSQSGPSLKEVDLTFFSTLTYSPMLSKYLQIIRPTVLQDMAVRFSIAIVKEEYEFMKSNVIDQIYWYIMFILSAKKLFGSRLRYHVYKIAEHCFSIFKPSLLRPLKQLMQQITRNERPFALVYHEEDIAPDAEDKRWIAQIFDDCTDNDYKWFLLERNRTLNDRQQLLVYRNYRERTYFLDSYPSMLSEEDLLKPIKKRVLEIMCERLQSDICQCAKTEIANALRYRDQQRSQDLSKNIHVSDTLRYRRVEKSDLFNLLLRIIQDKCIKFEKRIFDGVFKWEFVKNEIYERILEEIHILTPKVEGKYRELVKDIQEYDTNQHAFDLDLFSFSLFAYGKSRFEYIQEEALAHELALDKLHQYSILAAKIQEDVLEGLYDTAHKQIRKWMYTAEEIVELRKSLRVDSELEKFISQPPPKRHYYPVHVNKPLPKLRMKHSTR